jgi:hypothetical protein
VTAAPASRLAVVDLLDDLAAKLAGDEFHPGQAGLLRAAFFVRPGLLGRGIGPGR